MTDLERAALRAARDRLQLVLAAMDDLLGEEPELPLQPGELPCPAGGRHQFQLLDPQYGVYVCAACGAQEIREGG